MCIRDRIKKASTLIVEFWIKNAIIKTDDKESYCYGCLLYTSTDGFLRFTAKDIGTYKFVWQMLVYAVAAAVIMVLFITVPDVYNRQPIYGTWLPE